jgi:carbonic anhydrase
MRTPVEVADADLRALASLIGPNNRPVQNLGERRVSKACMP